MIKEQAVFNYGSLVVKQKGSWEGGRGLKSLINTVKYSLVAVSLNNNYVFFSEVSSIFFVGSFAACEENIMKYF